MPWYFVLKSELLGLAGWLSSEMCFLQSLRTWVQSPRTQDFHGRRKELTFASCSLTFTCTYTYINKYNFKIYVNCLIYMCIFLDSVKCWWFASFNYKLIVCHFCYFRVILNDIQWVFQSYSSYTLFWFFQVHCHYTNLSF